MAKEKSVFFCKNCGNESPKWIGKCPACGEWNTYVEERVATGAKPKSAGRSSYLERSNPQPIGEISSDETTRLDLCSEEVNRVLGGGLVACLSLSQKGVQ